ncbi:hypothetical protein [Pantoea sp. Acro-807]|uniref:hypothetical protein n=1 Tax=Pantoea sp. Acro-807 TaxID=2608356 RepID=UPI001FFD2C3A|nr:hypothetical protein [Pantoea sp. Acro-807]
MTKNTTTRMHTAEKQAHSFLFRLKRQDSPTGVSEETMNLLMNGLGLSQTEVAHLALRTLADNFLPTYQPDDEQLTPAQIQIIREASKASDIPEERFVNSLF